MTTRFGDRRSRKTATRTKAVLAALAVLLVGTAVAFLVVPVEPARAWSQLLNTIGW